MNVIEDHPALRTLCPPDVIVSWNDPERADGVELFREERIAVARAVRSRQLEFACGRACARAALARWGAVPAAIPVGPGRQPLWPLGYVGSITHTRQFCAAAVARADRYQSLGIDAEPDEPLPADVARMIRTSADCVSEPTLTPGDQPLSGRLAFCAKEAFYKLQYPLTGVFLDFSVVRVDLAPGSFVARLLADVPPWKAGTSFEGRWRRGRGLVVAAAWLDAETSDRMDR